jgi:UDPglucose--hexose-1-phosphate uridylyltransferase
MSSTIEKFHKKPIRGAGFIHHRKTSMVYEWCVSVYTRFDLYHLFTKFVQVLRDMFDFTDHSHKRYNPLSDSWVLCSPHRAKRPWLGQEEKTITNSVKYDPKCYLCPGNTRIGGELNPDYKQTFVFSNDFPAIKIDQPDYDGQGLISSHPKMQEKMNRLFKAEGVKGIARVICFSPKHNLTMAEMTQQEILHIVKEWIFQTIDIRKLDFVNYVQLFENKGAVMGCSNPHPHGQIWATSNIPQEPARELQSLTKYKKENGTCLLCDLVEVEMSSGERIVFQNETWICIVPFWAVWPFETLLLPKSHLSSIDMLSEQQQLDLAHILGVITCKYDNLFETSFPYSMGIHGAPSHDDLDDHPMHLHIHFYPPLLRSATVKKFLVGYVMLT